MLQLDLLPFSLSYFFYSIMSVILVLQVSCLCTVQLKHVFADNYITINNYVFIINFLLFPGKGMRRLQYLDYIKLHFKGASYSLYIAIVSSITTI